MSHINLFDTIAERFDFGSGTLGAARDAELTANFTIPDDGVIAYYFDPTAARDVTLPTYKRGAFHIITHVGAAFSITVKNPLGVTIATVAAGESVLFHCSGVEWKSLGGGTGSSFSPTDIASADGSIDVTVVGGTDIDLAVDEANVDHDLLFNFVANEHIDHTSVSISTAANSGLAGGGTIAATRSLSLDLNNLTTDTPVLADSFAFLDASGGDTNKATLSSLNSILDHDALLGFVANEHIDHSSVSISAGAGLTGGGNLTASRTLSLDINGLTADSITGADLLVFHDTSGGDVNKITLTNLNAALDHDALINYSANEHVDHTAVSISAGTGLTGGGTIAANRTISLAIDGLTADTPVAADVFAFYDDSGLDHNKVTLANLTTAIISQGSLLTTSTGQPLDATLTALAAFNTNGILTQTAADTFAGRTITGTTNQITVSNGSGVGGNPTLSLPADVIIPTVLTVPNTGLHILDTNASHDLIVAAGSNLTADHTLTLTTGDADRVLTISGDTTLGGGSHSGTNTGDETAAGILAKLVTVDGAGSGLDADLLDGLSSAAFYQVGGTDVALADGGTGASLADPNIDRIMMWDDSAGTVKFAALADINTEATPASGDFLLMYDAAGNLLKTDWNNLPGAAGGIPTEPSSTDNAVVRWDGAGGNAVQNSLVTISDDGIVDITNNFAGEIYLSILNTNTGADSAATIYLESQQTGLTSSMLITSTDGANYVSASDGFFYLGTIGADPAFFLTSGTPALGISATTQYVGIGTGFLDGQRRLHVTEETAATNTVTRLLRLTSTSSGTPAAGIGAGLEFEAETAAGNNEIGAAIEAVTVDVTSTSEDFDVVTRIMRAGAAASEAFRISNDWTYATDGQSNKNYMPHTKHLNSQHSVSSTTATEVTDLSHTLVAGTYVFEYYLICQAAATATGLTFAINYTGTATKLVAWLTWPDTGVTAALGAVDDAANATTGQVVAHAVTRTEATGTPNLSTGTAGVATQNVNLICKISGVIVVSDGGDLELWHGSETANATSVEVGSSLILTRTN